MIAKAVGRYLSVSPRKVRSVTRLIKGLDVESAEEILKNLPKGAARPIGKVVKSALANATRTGAWKQDQLAISRILVDEGPRARRFRASPMGRAMMYRKKMCHLTVELDVKK